MHSDFFCFYDYFCLLVKEQQQNSDRPGQLHLKWASKPVENRKVKSLAEIQAEEEQERLAKVEFSLIIVVFYFTLTCVCHIADGRGAFEGTKGEGIGTSTVCWNLERTEPYMG